METKVAYVAYQRRSSAKQGTAAAELARLKRAHASTRRNGRSKYNSHKTVIDSITFDSQHEAARYGALKYRQMAGEISDLETQPKFEISINGKHICNYFADFRYREGGEIVVEDAKSKATRKIATYRLKKKLVEAIYGIEIIEV